MKGAVMSFVLALAVFFNIGFTDCQVLRAQSVCRGEKRDLCEPGTVCEYNDIVNGKIQCRVTLGNNCTGLYYGSCAKGSVCNVLRPEGRICALLNGEDCTGRRDMCNFYDVCNFANKCRNKVGAWCPTFSREPYCGVGASCNLTTATCTCLPGVATVNDQQFCVPNAGRVAGSCGSDDSCDDPNTTCNTTAMLCQCDPGFATHWPDFSCRIETGQSCTGASNAECEESSVCDTDICKLKPGQSCAGVRANLCASGSDCINDVCLSDMRQACTSDATCQQGTRCVYTESGDRKCGLTLHAYCGNYTGDRCIQRHQFCDRVTNTCKIMVGKTCSGQTECPAGAECKYRRCSCPYPNKSFVPDYYACGLPKGTVGATCGTKKDRKKGCSDSNARCRNQTCQCKNGYRVDYSKATCELDGPKCSIVGEATLHTFFNYQLPLYLPCSFKLANFKCGGVKVEISASKMYSEKMEETYVSDVTVNVTSTKKGVSSTVTYWISNDMIQEYRLQNRTSDPKSGSWNKTCCTSTCLDDTKVKDAISTSAGNAVFKRRRLQISFKPFFSRPFKRPTSYFKKTAATKNSVPLLIECAHPDFESYDSYPDVLCGSPDDTEDDVNSFQREVELASKQELPDTFGFIPDEAFLAPRLLDHAVFTRQNVKHTDPRCAAAASAVSGGCSQLHEKMYNCSKMYDSQAITYTPMPPCVDSDIDPTELYLVCLRAVCNVTQHLTPSTCSALQQAADRCDGQVGRSPRHSWIEPPPFIRVSQLRTMANCP